MSSGQTFGKISLVLSILSHGHAHLIRDSSLLDENFVRNERESHNLAYYLNKLPLSLNFKNELINDIRISDEHNPSYYLGKFLQNNLGKVEKLRRSMFIIITSISQKIYS